MRNRGATLRVRRNARIVRSGARCPPAVRPPASASGGLGHSLAWPCAWPVAAGANARGRRRRPPPSRASSASRFDGRSRHRLAGGQGTCGSPPPRCRRSRAGCRTRARSAAPCATRLAGGGLRGRSAPRAPARPARRDGEYALAVIEQHGASVGEVRTAVDARSRRRSHRRPADAAAARRLVPRDGHVDTRRPRNRGPRPTRAVLNPDRHLRRSGSGTPISTSRAALHAPRRA